MKTIAAVMTILCLSVMAQDFSDGYKLTLNLRAEKDSSNYNDTLSNDTLSNEGQ